MKNIKTKKVTIVTAMAICMVSVAVLIAIKLLGVSFAGSNVGQGDTVKIGNGKYKIISEYDSFAQYIGPTKNSVKTVTIPDTINAGGKTYKVVSIGDYALNDSGNTLKKLTIGRNVICIGKMAFRYCKKPKTITIQTTYLTAENVKQASFYALNKKVTIIVPEQKLEEYTKILKSKDVGLTGKNQKINGKKMEEYNSFKNTIYDPDAEIPNPEVAMGINTAYQFRLTQTKETNEYSVGDTIPIAMKVKMPQSLFGWWELYMRDAGDKYNMCGTCGRIFELQHDSFSFEDFWMHTYVPINDKCDCTITNYYILGPNKESLVAWRKRFNKNPCSATFKITLPDGIDYKEGSAKVHQVFTLNFEDYYGSPRKIKDSLCHTEVSGREVMITIENIRAFILNANYHLYVELETEMNENASDSNTIEASLVYNYGKGDKSVDFNNVTVLKP